jgi:hypothetical protein
VLGAALPDFGIRDTEGGIIRRDVVVWAQNYESPTIRDWGPRGHNGVTATGVQPNRFGGVSGYRFTGNNTGIQLPANLCGNTFTNISMWAYAVPTNTFGATGQGNNVLIGNRSSSANADSGAWLAPNRNQQCTGYVKPPDASVAVGVGNARGPVSQVVSNQWTSFALTYSDNTVQLADDVRLYYAGNFVGATNNPYQMAAYAGRFDHVNSVGASFVSAGAPSLSWNGYIQRAVFFAECLTDEEVVFLHHKARGENYR